MWRAINLVSKDEYQTKKDALQEKLGRMLRVKEILAECKSTRPSEEDAIPALNAMLSFFLLADIEWSTKYIGHQCCRSSGNQRQHGRQYWYHLPAPQAVAETE
jgi:hypothetical protein